MSVNPFSFVLVFGLIALLIKNWNAPLETHIKNLFLCAVFLTLSTNVGFFMSIGSLEIGYPFFVSFLCFLFCVVYLIVNKRFDNKLMIAGVFFWISLLVGAFLAICMPYRGGLLQSITEWDLYVGHDIKLNYDPVFAFDLSTFIAVLRLPIILAVVFRIWDKQDFKKAIKWAMHIENFVIIYGFFEMVAKFSFDVDLTASFLNPVFGEASYTLFGAERLQGLFKEPSHYAQGLLYLSILNLFAIRVGQDRAERVWEHFKLAGLILLLVFSTSFSALLYAVLIVVALYPVVCRGVKARYIGGIGGCLAVVAGLLLTDLGFMRSLGLEDLYGRIDRTFRSLGALLTGKRATTSSEGARFTSMFYMVRILLSRPLCGAGIGVTDAHSTVFAVLGNTGLVGCGLWVYMLLRFGKIKRNGAFFSAVFFVCMALAGGIGYMCDLCFPFIFLCAGIALSEPLPQKQRARKPIQRKVVA